MNLVGTNKKSHLALSWLILLMPFFVACRGQDKINRRSIQDLYGEALDDASRRPDIIQPTFHARTSEFDLQPNSARPLPNDEATDAEQLTIPFPDNQANTINRLNSLSDISLANDINYDESFGLADPEIIPKERIRRNHRLPEIISASHLAALPSSLPDEQKISEIFEQTDIREAIQILATAANTSVVVDETIGGVTSAQIENETFEKALQKILLPIGLVYIKLDGKYLIAPPDPDSPLFPFISKRSQYSPNYHDVNRLSGLLPPRYKQYIQSSIERNLFVIDAPDEIRHDIIEWLRELDQPIPQVELEAIVCVVSPDNAFRFGLDWGHVVGVDGIDSLKAGMTGLTFSGAASPSGVDNAFSDFAVTSAFIKLLAQEGYVTIRAAPRVTAKDGEKASIAINREAFFSLQPTTSNVFFAQSVQKVDSGITLEITPRVHGDMVSVNISRAEVSEDIRTNSSQSDLTSNPFPIINRRVVSTQVNVRDGHTIVIGGLVQSQTVDRVNKVPGFSRIPVVGNMFKTIDKQKQDAEVAIFISPRIIPCERSCITP